jgi:hypothetical protein
MAEAIEAAPAANRAGSRIDPKLQEIAAQQQKAVTSKDAEILDSLDGMTFYSWGYSRPLKVTLGGEEKYLKLKIKSIGMTELMESLRKDAPKPPSSRKLIKKGTDVAKELGVKHDVMIYEQDEADPTYLRAVDDHNTKVSQMIVMQGLAYDLKLGDEVVLRGNDITKPNEVTDETKVLARFRQMGLSSEHFSTLVEDISDLTKSREAEEEED